MPSNKQLGLYLVVVVAPFLPIITWLPFAYGFNFRSAFIAYSVLALFSFIGATALQFLKSSRPLSIIYFLLALPSSWFLTIFGACSIYSDCL